MLWLLENYNFTLNLHYALLFSANVVASMLRSTVSRTFVIIVLICPFCFSLRELCLWRSLAILCFFYAYVSEPCRLYCFYLLSCWFIFSLVLTLNSLSFHLMLSILLRHIIPNFAIQLSSFCVLVHVLEPYVAIGMTNVSKSFIFVVSSTFFCLIICIVFRTLRLLVQVLVLCWFLSCCCLLWYLKVFEFSDLFQLFGF